MRDINCNYFNLQVCPCPEPTPCYQPVLPCCNPQCPPPIIPKQRPICPRAPPCPYPCLPVCRSCCPDCDVDPVTRRRPLIVHDSVFQNRPSGRPAECFMRNNPNVRYSVKNYVKQVGICTNNFVFNLGTDSITVYCKLRLVFKQNLQYTGGSF